MIRAKHLSNLSNCARSILYSGSRCNPTDGSSCSCTDDDKCVSRRQNVLLQPKSSPLVSSPASQVDSQVSKDAEKLPGPHNSAALNRTTSLPKTVTCPSTLGRSVSVSYSGESDTDRKDMVHSSPYMTEHLVKAGVAAVGFLSDLVNYRIPFTDGSETSTPYQNFMVNPSGSHTNTKPPNVKSVKKAAFYEVHHKPSSETPSVSNPLVNYQRPKDKADVSGTNVGNPSDKKNHIPQRAKVYASHYTLNPEPYIQPPRVNLASGVSPYISKHQRELKPHTGNALLARQFTSSSHVVESVLDILRRMKWGPAAEAALTNRNFLMDAYQANQVLKQIQEHSVALGFFYWLKRQPRFKHDSHTYTTMVGILGRAREFGKINFLLDQMAKEGCEPNVVTYNRLIHSYGRANYLSEAVNVFNQMQEAGCEPDRVTYCTLIDIHAKAGFLDVALYMYQKMQEAGLSPDTFTFSVMINCLGKAGHLAAAHKLFCEMVNHGCSPNLVTFNIMIALQAKARNYPVALQIYRDMQNAGYEPDKVTYSIVMEVLGHCGYLEEAEAIFSEMKRKNWVPDEPVYGLLVDLWGKAGNVEKALGWYRAMLNAGLCPNVPTCNSLLSAFLRVHRLRDAYNLLQSMVQMGLSPSLQTYTLLLSCCSEAKSSFDMGFCCELMAITGHPAHKFLLLMPEAGPDGKNVRDHVGKFLDLMHSEDRESKRGLVDAVVDFLHKSGLKEEAGSVWEVAAQKNVYPDAVKEKSSCYWLINLHVMSDGTAVTALSRTLAWFHRQLVMSGVSPCRIDIVTGWGRRSRVTGSSLVRQAVQDLLDIFCFPFFTENGNSGCFVGCGEPLNRWLLQPYVERMHLL